MPSGRGSRLLLIRSWVLGNEAHEDRNAMKRKGKIIWDFGYSY